MGNNIPQTFPTACSNWGMSQVKKYKIMCDLLWITICFSRVRRFTKDFHEWRTQAWKSFEIYTFITQWCIICTFPYEMHGLIGKMRLLTLNLILKMLQKENVNEYDDAKYQECKSLDHGQRTFCCIMPCIVWIKLSAGPSFHYGTEKGLNGPLGDSFGLKRTHFEWAD